MRGAQVRYFVTALAVLAAVACSSPRAEQPAQYDVLIKGGHIVDGSGNPWFRGDVAIKDGRIARIGRLDDAAAARVIISGLSPVRRFRRGGTPPLGE